MNRSKTTCSFWLSAVFHNMAWFHYLIVPNLVLFESWVHKLFKNMHVVIKIRTVVDLWSALWYRTVRPGAEERTFSRARLDVLNFRLRSYHVLNPRTLQVVMGQSLTKHDVRSSGWDVLVFSGWTFFGHAFFGVRSYCMSFSIQKLTSKGLTRSFVWWPKLWSNAVMFLYHSFLVHVVIVSVFRRVAGVRVLVRKRRKKELRDRQEEGKTCEKAFSFAFS